MAVAVEVRVDGLKGSNCELKTVEGVKVMTAMGREGVSLRMNCW